MSGFELNKILASVLLASLIAMLVGFIANAIYKPNLHVAKRGYQVEVVASAGDNNAAPAPEEFKPDVAKLMAAANKDNGEKMIKKCLTCHSFANGEPNKVGPNLFAVFGAEKAKHPGYNYSKALSSKGGNWDEDSLFHFIHKPSSFAPGTKMSFEGLKKPEDIADVVAYLKSNR